ncbi:ABC transporter permease [Winogradskyella flava]|uniref:ABC transporter permease n=1 Tax=Winogradskyella flava TaxID=1884876 RepID=UPI00249063D0|nr:ABC transporter permease [Winogradskyella flava]
MLKHNLKIAIRGFKKYKSSFIINIIGLSAGMACVLFISLWVSDEMSVDKFHDNEAQLYQVISNLKMSDEIITLDDSPILLADALTKEFPEVISATCVNSDFATPEGVFTYGDNNQVAKGLFAAPNFFEVFSFDLLVGNQSDVLNNKHKVVISEDLAKRLFKTVEDAVDKTLNWNYKWTDGNGEETLVISGVFKTPPINSTLQFEYIVHSDLLIDADRWAGDWSGHYAKSFLVLKDGTNISSFNKKIANYLNSKRDGKFKFTSFVQKFSERYLNQPYENGVQVGGRIVYIRLFIIIALFTLLIACINFMNLSTAQASRRMKEVGVKKTLGANRKSLIYQYLSEAIILVLISLVVAILLVILFLSNFNAITDKNIVLNFGVNQLLLIIGIILITGFLAGSYPAFRLSSFKPVEVLKGNAPKSVWEFFIRRGLVIFQFSISIIFIIGILVINKQIDFMQTKNLGYHKENVIQFEIGSNVERPEALLSELKDIPTISSVGLMNGDFLAGNDNNSGWIWPGKDSQEHVVFQSPRMGYGAIETLGMELIAGRTFSKEFNDDYDKIILNESALKLMNLENPIGKLLQKGEHQQEIVGIVKDFQYGSLHQKVEPLIIRFRAYGNNVMARINTGTEHETLSKMEAIYVKFNPGYSFDYSFLDSDYDKLYSSEQKVANLSDFFAALAIIISCLGLFGLATFTAERKAKEIGIRKILGSSVFGIVKMLSSEFGKMVIIAALIAFPIGYWLCSNWLSNFGYAIELKWWFFGLAGFVTLLIAMVTVGWQCYRAATANPINALKTE